MIRLLVMYPWPADPEHFKRHYLERHIPLCRAIPGALAVRYTFEPRTMQGGAKWFCLYEADYVDEETLASALASPECKEAAEDVGNYSPEPPVALIYELRSI